MKTTETCVGIILAGGQARRMGGGDKCLLPLAGKSLLQRVVDRAQPQVSLLILNANGNSLRFARMRLPVVPDEFENLGPLAGIHAGLKWMENNAPDREWLVSFAADTPFFPTTFVNDLFSAPIVSATALIVASSRAQVHPVFALWHVSLLKKIEQQLLSNDVPRLQDWVQLQKPLLVDFKADNYDPFLNINTPQDLYAAESVAALIH